MSALKVKVKYFAEARELVNLHEEVIVLQDMKVIDLIRMLATRHDKLKKYIFDTKTGNPWPYLQFMIDEHLVSNPDGLNALLTRDCTFAIIPPIGGG